VHSSSALAQNSDAGRSRAAQPVKALACLLRMDLAAMPLGASHCLLSLQALQGY